MDGQTRQVVVLYFITIFSLFSRYNSLEKDPPPPSYNYFEDLVSAGYDPQAYPSYFTTTIDDGHFKDLISQRTQVISQLQKLGVTSAPSTKTVNVNDFGATGDATQDTRVRSHRNIYIDVKVHSVHKIQRVFYVITNDGFRHLRRLGKKLVRPRVKLCLRCLKENAINSSLLDFPVPAIPILQSR